MFRMLSKLEVIESVNDESMANRVGTQCYVYNITRSMYKNIYTMHTLLTKIGKYGKKRLEKYVFRINIFDIDKVINDIAFANFLKNNNFDEFELDFSKNSTDVVFKEEKLCKDINLMPTEDFIEYMVAFSEMIGVYKRVIRHNFSGNIINIVKVSPNALSRIMNKILHIDARNKNSNNFDKIIEIFSEIENRKKLIENFRKEETCFANELEKKHKMYTEDRFQIENRIAEIKRRM